MSVVSLLDYVVNSYLRKANEVFADGREVESDKWRFAAAMVKQYGTATIEDGKCILLLKHPEHGEEKIVIELDMECQVLTNFLNNLTESSEQVDAKLIDAIKG